MTFIPNPFYDRCREMAAFDRLSRRPGTNGQMMLLYGRRRLGKTFLLQRYFTVGSDGLGPEKPHCYYLAEQSSAAQQRMILARQLLTTLGGDGVAAEEIAVSWNALFRYLTSGVERRRGQQGRFALILDEFPYLVAQTPELPSILQSWWDREGTHIPVLVVLCGSQLSAMASLGEETAPLYGRFNAGVMLLEPLEYEDAAAFYEGSAYYGVVEKLLMYGVFGGTPRYHAMVDKANPAAAEIVSLLMQPHAILENEVRFLLGSEQIRDPSPYNAVLSVLAAGETKFNRIQQAVGVERGALSSSLRSLLRLGWIRRELPFGEDAERRALYRIADPFLTFWYRFISPLASQLQFSDAQRVYEEHVAPRLNDYMGWSVFEQICGQWLGRHAAERLGIRTGPSARYWSRNGQVEIDRIAEIEGGGHLFAECKWRTQGVVKLGDLARLQAKVAALSEPHWRERAHYALFTPGDFAPELRQLASDPAERIFLVSGKDLLPLLDQ